MSRKTWEPLDNLTNCAAAIFAFERSSGRPLPRPAPPQPAFAAPLPVPIPPAGFTIDAALLGDLRAELVGRTLLYWWPADGWQRGTAARLCGAFSHVDAYTRQTSHCVAPQKHSLTPPRTASIGSCFLPLQLLTWTGLQTPPESPAGPAARDPGPDFPMFRLVGGSSQVGPGRAWQSRDGQGRADGCVIFGSRVATALVYIAEPGAR